MILHKLSRAAGAHVVYEGMGSINYIAFNVVKQNQAAVSLVQSTLDLFIENKFRQSSLRVSILYVR